MDKVLSLNKAKNEDLEVRPRQTNVRILGVAETTDTGKMETFFEDMLITQFGQITSPNC